MEYHKFDIQNSSSYDESIRQHNRLNNIANEEFLRISRINNNHTFEIQDIMASRSKECVKDTSLEYNLLTDQYNLGKYKSFCPTNEDHKNYSDCLGYQCNRNHPHDFMYQLDEYNTYHNYLVCDYNEKICCPKNTQIFNNLTRRHHSSPQSNKQQTTLILEENNIPIVTMKECKLYR